MGIIKEDKVEEVKEAHDIVDLISGYLEVKSSGNSYKALCPFHSEKTPSFMINREKQMYKCFGCGEAGDVLQFVMKMENLEFVDALRNLAEKANIEIEETEGPDRLEKEKRQRLYEMNRKAAIYFYRNLTKSKNPGLSYLVNRGLGKEEIKAFGLGFSLDRWDGLLEHLKKEGYSPSHMMEAGLVLKGKKEDHYYDRFRNRVMYPIFNVRGKVIGFGGRVLDQSLPKYLNSPESMVFNKRKTLYNLHLAKNHIEKKRLILVEGYMDAIALYGNGVKNVVATLGTSLTTDHASLLKKYAREVVLAFDGDEAGINATLRSIHVLESQGLKVRVLDLEKGQDPDDLIGELGEEGFLKRIDSSSHHIVFQIQRKRREFNLRDTEDKVDFTREVIQILTQIKSPVEQEAYIDDLSKELDLSKDGLMRELKNQRSNPQQERRSNVERDDRKNNWHPPLANYIYTMPSIEKDGHIKLEKLMIKFMLDNPDRIERIKSRVEIEDFSIEAHRKIVEYLFLDYQGENHTLHLQEYKDSMDEIAALENPEGEINKILEEYLWNLKKYRLVHQKTHLESEQEDLMKNTELPREEVDRILLKIGMEIMEINKKLQGFQSREGRV